MSTSDTEELELVHSTSEIEKPELVHSTSEIEKPELVHSTSEIEKPELVHSISEDNTLGLEYLDNYPEMLPTDKALGHGHLIECPADFSLMDVTKLRLADAIVTTLHNFRPDFLRHFFDTKTWRVTFNFVPGPRKHLSWGLDRTKDSVMCHTYRSEEEIWSEQPQDLTRQREIVFKYQLLDRELVPMEVGGSGVSWNKSESNSTVITTVEGLGALHAKWLLERKLWIPTPCSKIETFIQWNQPGSIRTSEV